MNERHNHDNFHVHGYNEEGTTTTPFDMTVQNQLDRFHLAIDAIDRVPSLGASAGQVRQHFLDTLGRHRQFIREYGDDMPEIRNWTWRPPAS